MHDTADEARRIALDMMGGEPQPRIAVLALCMAYEVAGPVDDLIREARDSAHAMLVERRNAGDSQEKRLARLLLNLTYAAQNRREAVARGLDRSDAEWTKDLLYEELDSIQRKIAAL